MVRMSAPMRFGLVGTGPWASTVHGPALGATDGIELVGVWGRSPDKTAALAGELEVTPFAELVHLLDAVDAVAFAVPPDVQADLAVRAARAGRHLLLDKPVALSGAQARAVAEAAEAHRVSSVVFFTDRFSDEGAAWLDALAGTGPWFGGDVRWLATLDVPGNPYAASAWRHEGGALWDIGPHVLSTLIGALGPVTRVSAVAGARDLVHLTLQHVSGASSTATISLFAPPAAVTHEALVWGEPGISRMPARAEGGAVAALSRAGSALRECAVTGSPHPADLRLGVQVVELLEDAAWQVAAPRP
jgi:predicted dehydrogenase